MTEQRGLTVPIRLYWDVGPPPPGDTGLLQRICEAIVAGKVLSIDLLEPGDVLSSPCLAVLRHLSTTPVALSLTVSPSALDSQTKKLLRGIKLRKLLVRAASSSDLPKVADALKRVETVPSPGLSFEVNRRNFRSLPDVLAFCIGTGMKDLVLPMQRLTGDGECFTVTAEERRALTEALDTVAGREAVRITIHDPFLWRAFFPGIDFPGRGCQAADTMVYVSPLFDVYPCPTMPVKLGSLLHTTLAGIIGSRERSEVRKVVDAPPEGCGGCEEQLLCRGGCRGRTFKMENTLDGRDPSCR